MKPLALGLSLALWAQAGPAASAPAGPGPRGFDCALAVECSDGETYIGCDAVEQCEAAGGTAGLGGRRRAGLGCEIIVFCSNGEAYTGCDAVRECEEAGGVPSGSP